MVRRDDFGPGVCFEKVPGAFATLHASSFGSQSVWTPWPLARLAQIMTRMFQYKHLPVFFEKVVDVPRRQMKPPDQPQFVWAEVVKSGRRRDHVDFHLDERTHNAQ